MIAGKIVPMPASVRMALGEVTNRDVLIADTAPWRQAADALRADPQAEIKIELPVTPPPLPKPPQFNPVPPEAPPPPSAPDDGDPGLVSPEDAA
jgi:hypothetical protein